MAAPCTEIVCELSPRRSAGYATSDSRAGQHRRPPLTSGAHHNHPSGCRAHAGILRFINGGPGRARCLLADGNGSRAGRWLQRCDQRRPLLVGNSQTNIKVSLYRYKKFLDPDGYPATAPPWGTLNAINLATGQYAWKIPLGEYPELVKQGLKDTGTENYGGPIVTAGGVVFIGATNFDRKFRAFDKDTGRLLWETTLPFAANTTPLTYEVEGRQYMVVPAGGGKSREPSGGVFIAVRLAPSALEPRVRRETSPRAGCSARGRRC